MIIENRSTVAKKPPILINRAPGFVAAMIDPDWRRKEAEYRYHEHIQIQEQIRKSWGLPEGTPWHEVPMITRDAQAKIGAKLAELWEQLENNPIELTF